MKYFYRVVHLFLLSTLCAGTNALPANPQSGENMWHLLAAVGTVVDQISSSQSTCCVETFTVLDAIKDTIDSFANSSCDLSGTFTALAILTNQVITIESKVENLSGVIVSNFSSTFTALAAITNSSFSDTFTLIDAANQIELATQSKLNQCCDSIESKLSFCNITPIDQNDVVGTLTLSVAKSSYCLSQSVTGNIVIAASDISLNLNQNTLNGSITVLGTGDRATIFNGKIAPSTRPASGNAITIQAADATIENVHIECAPAGTVATPTIGVNGINTIALNTLIKNCFILAGKGGLLTPASSAGGIGVNNTVGFLTVVDSVVMGGQGGDSLPGGTGTGAGGFGIQTNGNSSFLRSTIIGGSGGNGANNTSGVGNAPAGGSGNSGVSTTASFGGLSNITFKNCIIRSGNGGNGGSSNSGSAGAGNSSSSAILTTQSFITVDSCFVVSGNGGQGGSATAAGVAAGAGGSSGTCVNLNPTSNNSVVKNCTIVSGTPGSGGVGQAPTGFITQGAGGSAGGGVNLSNLSNSTVINNFIRTNNGANGTMPAAGSIPSNGGSSAPAVAVSLGSQALISGNTIITGNGGNAVGGTGFNSSGGTGGMSGNGITITTAPNVTVSNNIITTGNGGNATTSLVASNAQAGATSGHAIQSSGQAIISNNTLRTGNAGNGANSSTTGGVGGAAGHGIFLQVGNNSKILNNAIASVGQGGNGGTGATAGNGGNSGNGITIASIVTRTQIGFNNISNTQIGGTGNVNGTNGFAILDQASTVGAASAIFGNFASDIANATSLSISAQSAATSTPSVGIASSTNKLNNVHAP
jgi:hypothetical protein